MKNKKIFILFLIVFMLFTFNFNSKVIFNAENKSQSQTNKDELPSTKYYNCYKYTGEIPHFFTHEMVTNPSIAYSNNNSLWRAKIFRSCNSSNR